MRKTVSIRTSPATYPPQPNPFAIAQWLEQHPGVQYLGCSWDGNIANCEIEADEATCAAIDREFSPAPPTPPAPLPETPRSTPKFRRKERRSRRSA